MSGANVSPIGRNKEEWFVPTTDYRKLNEPPRPRFSKERGHLLDGAATPPLPRRGVPFGCFATFQVHCVFTNPTVLPADRRSDLKRHIRGNRRYANVTMPLQNWVLLP